MNTPVSFELAKQLKEKGFRQSFGNGQKFYYPPTKELTENHRGDNYAAPTIAEVIIWLYEKHKIWISIQPNEPYMDDWVFTIFKNLKNNTSLEGYDSPTEAYEAAIIYTLKNLI